MKSHTLIRLVVFPSRSSQFSARRARVRLRRRELRSPPVLPRVPTFVRRRVWLEDCEICVVFTVAASSVIECVKSYQ